MIPKLGAPVHYVSRTGDYEVAAIINAVPTSLHRGNVDKGFVPDIYSDGACHLTVMTPGIPAAGLSARQAQEQTFKVASEAGLPAQPNQGGTYPEWSVPFDSDGGPGSWHYPEACPHEF